jgi:hypothetical protein
MGVNKELVLDPPPSPPPLAAAPGCVILPHHLHHTTKGHAYEEITDDPIDEEEFWTNMGKVRGCVLVRDVGISIYCLLGGGRGGLGREV